jgi:hypothetical protein
LGMLAIVLVYFPFLLKPLILFQCMIKRTYNKIHIIEDLTHHSLLVSFSCFNFLDSIFPQYLFLPWSFLKFHFFKIFIFHGFHFISFVVFLEFSFTFAYNSSIISLWLPTQVNPLVFQYIIFMHPCFFGIPFIYLLSQIQTLSINWMHSKIEEQFFC